MTWIALIRHGTTGWNERGLIQGRTDTSLSATGIANLRRISVGNDWLRARWVSSPLKRALQTAEILNPHTQAEIHHELIETNWGKFEGLRSVDIPQHIRKLGLQPDHGLDFLPPDGESPRMVRQRIETWLQKVAEWNTTVIAITHKGLIRGALSVACDWDMSADFSSKPDWSLPHLFRVNPDGKIQLVRLNCAWDTPIEAPS